MTAPSFHEDIHKHITNPTKSKHMWQTMPPQPSPRTTAGHHIHIFKQQDQRMDGCVHAPLPPRTRTWVLVRLAHHGLYTLQYHFVIHVLHPQLHVHYTHIANRPLPANAAECPYQYIGHYYQKYLSHGKWDRGAV